jgi:hypothetical protein
MGTAAMMAGMPNISAAAGSMGMGLPSTMANNPMYQAMLMQQLQPIYNQMQAVPQALDPSQAQSQAQSAYQPTQVHPVQQADMGGGPQMHQAMLQRKRAQGQNDLNQVNNLQSDGYGV